ncbi:MAG: AAA family ATPase [Lachnospiraceae bacterium]|nr:AAA family ATPase [Lachnospiraceae bacterium]
MGKAIAITNQKGGVGKTTTAINLSACLAENGMKVLVLDIDPQGNCSSGLGVDKDSVENSIYQLLIGECGIREAILHTEVEGLDIIPSDVNLAGAEIELLDVEDKEYLLCKKVAEVKEEYDYILIDCPPSLNTLTLNAMTTADSIIVPIQCEYYALEGLSQLIRTIELVRNRLNENLSIDGVVFTMFDGRTNLSLQVVENVRANLSQNIYASVIPRNVRLAEAPSHGLPITLYDSRSVGAEAYREFALEVMQNDKKKPVGKKKRGLFRR